MLMSEGPGSPGGRPTAEAHSQPALWAQLLGPSSHTGIAKSKLCVRSGCEGWALVPRARLLQWVPCGRHPAPASAGEGGRGPLCLLLPAGWAESSARGSHPSTLAS